MSEALSSVVRAATSRLAEAGIASPGVDAVELLAHVLGEPTEAVHRAMVLGRDLTPEQQRTYAAVLDERARRVPLQHLTGRAHFRRITLHVGPGVFVPRPETEVLVDLALAEVDSLAVAGAAAGPRGPVRVVDLCTGSGAIALSVKEERPDVRVRAVELSPDAVAWAVANRDRSGLDVEITQGDATGPCLPDWAGTVDVLTVNPPYIPTTAVPLDPEVRDHDPELALYGGSEDGLAIPLRIATTAAVLLRPGGLLLMEHADAQGRSLPARLAATGAWTEVLDHEDLTGRPRVTTARRVGLRG